MKSRRSVHGSDMNDSKFTSFVEGSRPYDSSNEISSTSSRRDEASSADHQRVSIYEKTKKKPGNPLLNAMSKVRTRRILKMNSAGLVKCTEGPQDYDDATGLNEEQRRILRETKFLFRYNDNWRTNWDLFVMLLAIWN